MELILWLSALCSMPLADDWHLPFQDSPSWVPASCSPLGSFPCRWACRWGPLVQDLSGSSVFSSQTWPTSNLQETSMHPFLQEIRHVAHPQLNFTLPRLPSKPFTSSVLYICPRTRLKTACLSSAGLLTSSLTMPPKIQWRKEHPSLGGSGESQCTHSSLEEKLPCIYFLVLSHILWPTSGRSLAEGVQEP